MIPTHRQAARAAIATTLTVAGPAMATDVHVERHSYAIHGRTVTELKDAVVEASQILGEGRHAAASASFEFKPELEYLGTKQGCIIANVRVQLVAKITLPEWMSSRGADEETVAAWRRFSHYVKNHEARHEAIASDYRQLMAKELDAIGVMESCPALGREAVAVVADLKRMHDAAQIAFDREERARSLLLGR